MSRLPAMDFFPVEISAEMLGKIYVLATNTMGMPTNDDCEQIAVNLLDAALDAALEVHDGSTGCVDLDKAGVKFALIAPLPVPPPVVAKKATPKKRGGSKR